MSSSTGAQPTAGLDEKFSRQVILPGVGKEGQAKWAAAQVTVAGEGAALEAVVTALKTAGLSQVTLHDPQKPLGQADLFLVMTEKADLRRNLNRSFRRQNQPALFAWPAGSGYALFLSDYQTGKCPCFECFEIMNPKAFNAPLRQGSGGQAGDFPR
jgi:hypothetical protein